MSGATFSLKANRWRDGGGYRWSIDTDDPHLQAFGVLLSRARQPEGAPRWDEGRTHQSVVVDEAEGLGWSTDWVGWTHRSGWTVSVEEGTRAARLVNRLHLSRRARAERRRRRRGGMVLLVAGGTSDSTLDRAFPMDPENDPDARGREEHDAQP